MNGFRPFQRSLDATFGDLLEKQPLQNVDKPLFLL